MSEELGSPAREVIPESDSNRGVAPQVPGIDVELAYEDDATRRSRLLRLFFRFPEPTRGDRPDPSALLSPEAEADLKARQIVFDQAFQEWRQAVRDAMATLGGER